MRKEILHIALFFSMVFCQNAQAQTTEFSFQGQLQSSSASVSGNFDFEFLLFDALSGGTQIGSTITRNSVAVANGIFSVKLDFGASFPGANRFLEIRVQQTGGGGFTPLTPRQSVTSAPYSVKTLTADNATNAQQLGGIAAGQYVLTGDVRLSDARAASSVNFGTATLTGVVPIVNGGTGSPTQNFVDLTNAQTIGGNKTFSGTLSGNIVNAVEQYNIGGSRVLSIGVILDGNIFAGRNSGFLNTGDGNSFVGASAGLNNSMGGFNSFFGLRAGEFNTTGGNNSFFGAVAGDSNTTGVSNSFFGALAGDSNTEGSFNSFFGKNAGLGNTGGTRNAFFGLNAGDANVTGSNNTVIGNNADVGSGALNFATALGADAVVSASNTIQIGRGADTVQVPGSLNVTGTFTGNINATNITSGTLTDARLSTNIATLSGAQTFTGAKAFSGGISGNGSGLTNLSTGNLTGTVAIANGGTGSATQNFVDLTNAQTIGGGKTFSNTMRVLRGASGATAASTADLIVEDNASAFQHFLTPNDIESGILFGDPAVSVAGGIVFNNAATNNGIQFRAGGNTTRMTLDGAGNLGIGIAPNTKLDVVSTESQIRFGDTTADSGGYLLSTISSQAVIAGGAKWNGSAFVAKSTDSSAINMFSGAIRFFNNSGLTPEATFTLTEHMRITASGNVGIGTISPAAKLDVDGNIQVTGEVRRPATGTANMLPLCYGHILQGGVIASGSGNFTVTYLQNSATSVISVPGENFGVGANAYTVMVQVMNNSGPVMARTSTLGGDLTVNLIHADGADRLGEFSFVIYKP